MVVEGDERTRQLRRVHCSSQSRSIALRGVWRFSRPGPNQAGPKHTLGTAGGSCTTASCASCFALKGNTPYCSKTSQPIIHGPFKRHRGTAAGGTPFSCNPTWPCHQDLGFLLPSPDVVAQGLRHTVLRRDALDDCGVPWRFLHVCGRDYEDQHTRHLQPGG